MIITSLQNEKVKYWVSLKEKKVRDKYEEFIIEGEHLIDEAKKLGLVKTTISMVDKNADYFVTEEIMKKISSQKSISYNIAVVSFLKEDSPKNKILILDNLQDPGNLGTIIRSAVAFNFDTIIIGDTSVDLYNPKVIRATEGMIFHINILRRNLLSTMPILKNLGYKIIGTDVIKGKDIRNINFNSIAVIIGNEGKGISDNLKKYIDSYIYIPMNSKCESLNAGVAASIIMYEVNNG